jgi:uncharacterized protein
MLCPICKKKVQRDGEFMPFCSDRCRIIDLGNWASEKYVIPGASSQEAEDSDDESSESE